ncbi:O-methyltransferase [Microtetraspora sp. NBRC 13810]|uniref:methyltransferase n=1 Tax=Microtetraspora sp. NBRC 13810 TaxID=3030990 RepID=UPI0024A22182|nr:methyltransferase [Microtetraspora sp. NBRC 13810]GLW06783.1 O-methyltransferase [Microtetraspora sp. NBRC 13810]
MTSTAPDVNSAQGILQLGNAFAQAQAVLTAVELDLFTALDAGPATGQDVAARLGLHGRGLRDLLRLLAALGLLEEEDGRFANAPGAARHLVGGRPGYVGGALLGAKANLYHLWDGLAETLRSGRPRSAADGFAAMLADGRELRRYVRMMEGSLEPLVPGLLKAIDWAGRRSVLDVGGGRGALAGRLVAAHPGLAGHVFDLPEMEPLFGEHMAELGLTGAVRFHAGDFFRDELPRADVLVLGHILHNWPPERRGDLMGAAFRAVNPGGLLLVHDRMLDDGRPGVDNLLASLIMALVTEGGSEYPVAELAGLARDAGFAAVDHRPLAENETLVLCRKAA